MTFLAFVTTAGIIAAVGIREHHEVLRLRLVEARVHPALQPVDRIR